MTSRAHAYLDHPSLAPFPCRSSGDEGDASDIIQTVRRGELYAKPEVDTRERAGMTGPLAGVRVIEIAGLGAAPYGCMMLADMGAEVVRVDRIGGGPDTPESSPLLRNRRSMTVDLKQPAGCDFVIAMTERADVLIEAFRPGVAVRIPGETLHAQLANNDTPPPCPRGGRHRLRWT